MKKYLVHIYQHASGHKQVTRQRVYEAKEVEKAMENWRLLGGSLEWASTMPGAGEFEQLRFDVMMSEISEAIDGNSYRALTQSKPGSSSWDRAKVKLMNVLHDIYFGDFHPD